jgi:uncharacterized protein (TIGR02391 family)
MYVSREFTEDEISLGEQKLWRRIAEVKALKEKGVRFDDQAVKTAEFNIQETIREVFGEDSAEYDRHRHHDIWQGPIYMGMQEYQIQQQFEAGILQTVAMLEGLVRRLQEKRLEIFQRARPRAPVALRDLDIYSRILGVVTNLFSDGHYANAVLDGAIALTNYVKEKSGRHHLDGAPLMRTVFSANAPILAFNELKDQTDRDEQEGMMHLFEGIALGVRNPRAHELFDHHPQRALEYIVLLSLLTKRVDKAVKMKGP